MMQANSMKTVIGGLSLLLVLSACSSGSKPKAASTTPPSDLPRSDVVTDRGTTPGTSSGTSYGQSNRTMLSDSSPEFASACPSKMDAQGNRVFDDPSCPDRYRSQAGKVDDRAGLAAACPSKVDANGKVVYNDPTCPDRYRRQAGMAGACASRVDANGKVVYDDQSCPPKNRYLTQENAFYDRYADKAAKHARAAEIAANQGNIPDMLQNAEISLDHAKEARRAGINADLATGIAALRESIRLGEGSDVSGATSSIREARISLSKAAGIKTWNEPLTAAVVTPARAHTVKGELSRNERPTTGVTGGEQYVVRDAQNHEVPIALSPEMSQQVQVGDTVEAQIDSTGKVTSISKAQ